MSFTLVYDSDCGICTTFKDAVAFLDHSHRIRSVSLDFAEVSGALEDIPKTLRRASFHLITPTGTVISGAIAIPYLAAELPVGNVSRRVLEVPPIARFIRSLYGAFVSVHDSSTCNPEDRASQITTRTKLFGSSDLDSEARHSFQKVLSRRNFFDLCRKHGFVVCKRL